MLTRSIATLLLLPLTAVCWFDAGWTEQRAREHWLKLSQQKDIREAMRAAWARSLVGTSGFEAGFRLDGDANDYRIVPVSAGHSPGHLEVAIAGPGEARTFAIFHVHPNASGPEPSNPRTSRNGRGDTSVADEFEISVFVMHRRGLTVYDHSLRQNIPLHTGLKWAQEE
ncbi:MAG: hypothetical protein SFV51_01080 [Bryobacteraceae bacterium]|nr:hypothetical protein [Bryobacteraceae bacterium]